MTPGPDVQVDTPREHWKLHARRWNLVGRPLRPPPEDIEVCRAAVCEWQSRAANAAPRAVVLGVTPELVAMDWPPAFRVLAIDLSLPMIQGLWPDSRPRHAAACADWLALPLPGGSVQVMVGDGSFNALASGDRYPAMVESLRRVIDPDGRLVLRFFVRPDTPEPVGGVLGDLVAGRIGSFHAFKWRLAMAVHGDLSHGVRLADIWDSWHAGVPDPAALMAERGWPVELLETIDGYRGVDTCYTFPTLDEARAALATDFVEHAVHTPGYELGDRCPTFVLRPR